MAIQTILTWTIAPNGVDRAKGLLRASVVVSPMVALAPGKSTPIASHPWLANWPKTLTDAIAAANGNVNVKVGKRGDVAGRVSKATLATVPESLAYPAGRNLWIDLLKDSIAGTIPDIDTKQIEGLGEIRALGAQRERLARTLRGADMFSASVGARDDGETQVLDRISTLGRTPSPNDIMAIDGTRSRLDFHERIASFLGYRSVARELGLILDVMIEFDGGEIDWVRLEPPAVQPAPVGEHTLTHQTPRTLVEVAGAKQAPELFRALPAVSAAQHAMPPPPDVLVDGFASLTDDGLIHLDPTTTEISCWDPVVEAALKNDRKAPATRFGNDQLIIISPTAQRALNAWNARANTLRSSTVEVELFADDLVRGFAIDLAEVHDDTSPAAWRSLCARRGEHRARTNGAPTLVEPGEEAPLELALFKATDNSSYTAQSIFRLDGWSLACPRPDRAHDDETDHREEMLITDLTPPDHSLPRLRYGKRYLCRARAIDLAGNDLTKMTRAPSRADDRSAIERFSLDFFFDRTSPVPAPIVVPPREYAAATSSWPSDPQSAGHVAVGYAFTRADSTKDEHREETRWVLPPVGSVAVTEFEGSLDRESDDEAYAIIERVDKLPPAVMLASARVEYLPDPFSDGVVFEGRPEKRGEEPFFDGAPGMQGATDPVKSDWPNRLEKHQPIRLRVRPADEAFQPDPQRETKLSAFLSQHQPGAPGIAALCGRDQPPAISDTEAVFFVRRGKRHRIAVRSWTDNAHRDNHAMLHIDSATELFGASVAEVAADEATAIRDNLATPATLVELTHPVDKPLFHPRLYPEGPKAPLRAAQNQRWFAPRELDALDVRLVFSVLVHAGTTGQVDLLASWKDAVDEGTSKPQELIVSARDVRAIESGYLPGSGLKVFDLEARQVFPDHKCRIVTYRLRAATAFPEYYTPAEVRAQAYYGHQQAVIIPATRPPAPPTIDRIVPAFMHVKENVLHHHRRVRLRITLARDWYSSGDGELLAVLVQPPTKASGLLDGRVQDACTIWGNDPIRALEAPGDPRASVRVTNSNAMVTHEVERGRERGLSVNVHTFETKVEATREVHGALLYERFVDLALEVGDRDAYNPFIRLALARFQPNAVDGAKLSDAVFATFIQLPPDRSVTIVDEGANLEIQVTGPGPQTNEMWISFVTDNERRIAVDTSNNVELVSASMPLLIGARDSSKWTAGQTDGRWSKKIAKPNGKSRLVILEREKVGGEWSERTVCNIPYDG